MKKTSTTCMLLLIVGLVSSPIFAIEYCKDFLELGNRGGWYGSRKTFDEEWTMEVGDEVDLDIWVNDVPLYLVSGGFWIQYDPSEVSIVSVNAYDSYELGEPWSGGFTSQVPDAGGPGTYFLAVVPGLGPGPPDGDGDYIIGKVRFRSESEGGATITISTIPGFDTFVGDTTVFDPEITPNTVTIHQIIRDADNDGIPDHEDNCPYNPNPSQTNSDSDSHGDACDNCPLVDNEDQEDSNGNGIGDACDTDGAQIPTLSEWGMIIFITIILGISVVMLLRRKEA